MSGAESKNERAEKKREDPPALRPEIRVSMETLLSLRREDLWPHEPDPFILSPEEEIEVSPASSCESIKSDRSMTPPPLSFKGNISYRHDNTKYRFEIIPGSPSVYRLKPEQGNKGSIRRLTLGEKDPTKINKTILLVGETGTGKSTLINALVNYALGVKFEDNVCFQIVEEEKKSQAESQTSDVIVYEVFGLEDRTLPFSLTIINTPGFGHTRGTEQDVLVRERLFDLFRSTDGVHEIDAVCLVLKASDCRLSDRLMYVFDSVVSLFGKDIEKNIVALITHSDFLTPDNALEALTDAKIMCAKDKEGQPVHFMFNNIQKTERNKRNDRTLKNAWESTEDQISQFADFLKDTKPQDLRDTVEVLNSRIRLTACIHNMQERIEFIEQKQREIQLTQEGLKKHEQDMKNNEDFKIERRVKKDKQQLKEKYEKGKKDSEESGSLLETLQENMTELQKDKDQFLEESFQHVDRLEEIALNGVSLSTRVKLDFLIEKMKEKGETEKVKKLEMIKSKMEENPRVKSALSYMSGKRAAIGKAARDLL